MNIDTSTIENFNELSADELRTFISEFTYDDANKELEQKVATYKNSIDKLTKENAEYKRQVNATKSAEEVAKAEAEERQRDLQEKYDTLLRETELTRITSQYQGLGFSSELAKSTAEAQVSGDFGKVVENMSKFKTEFEKNIRAELIKGTKKPDINGKSGESTVTKEQFANMSYTERVKLYETNRELYNELSKG